MTGATKEPSPRSPDYVIDEHPPDGGGGRRAGRAVGSGVRWMGPTQVGMQLIRIGSMLALTRLLTPQDFGVVALVTVVTGFFERVLGDTGTTVAMVRVPRLTQGLASSVFFWNLSIGAMTTALLMVWASPIARLLGDPDATGIVRGLGFLALVNSFMHVPNGLFRRRMQFRHLALANVTNVSVTAIVSLALALSGVGVWSLVIGTIAGSAVGVALCLDHRALEALAPLLTFDAVGDLRIQHQIEHPEPVRIRVVCR